ncbi:CidA/LrgA family protein [Alteromonas ponticola]|uniref:CidA/LrgA family protein n=1 Tax=Alteromonas ponticola TaxID=2720613 RepID=A0ABX1QYP2_9ALTE|nr:CidA/LrgA family protein [Alteromonas ponticola]NMH59345.1 CidA/LrgA family protein [Alteromonas ponticola]
MLVVQFSLPLPGALLGLGLLSALMALSKALARAISRAAQPILANMSFFFIPAVLGIAIYWSILQANLLAILLAIVGSTVVSLGVSYWLAKKLLSRQSDEIP